VWCCSGRKERRKEADCTVPARRRCQLVMVMVFGSGSDFRFRSGMSETLLFFIFLVKIVLVQAKECG